MSLVEYIVKRDHFKEDEEIGGFSFPCNVCQYRHGKHDDMPCRVCDHNSCALPDGYGEAK